MSDCSVNCPSMATHRAVSRRRAPSHAALLASLLQETTRDWVGPAPTGLRLREDPLAAKRTCHDSSCGEGVGTESGGPYGARGGG